MDDQKNRRHREEFLDKLISDKMSSKTGFLKGMMSTGIPSTENIRAKLGLEDGGSNKVLRPWENRQELFENTNNSDWLQKQILNQTIDSEHSGSKPAIIRELQINAQRNQLQKLKQKHINGINSKQQIQITQGHFTEHGVGYSNLSSQNFDLLKPKLQNLSFQKSIEVNKITIGKNFDLYQEKSPRNTAEQKKSNRKKKNALNFSMQFNSKDGKFLRQIDQFYCNPNRKGQSIDFKPGQLTDILTGGSQQENLSGSRQVKQSARSPGTNTYMEQFETHNRSRRRNHPLTNFATLNEKVYQNIQVKKSQFDKLPSIKNATILDVMPENKSRQSGMKVQERATTMTQRDTDYKHKESQLVNNSPLLINQSLNYSKYEKMKNIWGAGNQEPAGGKTLKQEQEGKVKINVKHDEPSWYRTPREQVFGREEQIMYSDSVKQLESGTSIKLKTRAPKVTHVHTTVSRQHLKSKIVEKQINEYNTQTQQDIIDQQTISLQANFKSKNTKSLISTDTDNTVHNTILLTPQKAEDKQVTSGGNQVTNMNVDSAANLNNQNTTSASALNQKYSQFGLQNNLIIQNSGFEQSYDSQSNGGMNNSEIKHNLSVNQNYQFGTQLMASNNNVMSDASVQRQTSQGEGDHPKLAPEQYYMNQSKWVTRELRGKPARSPLAAHQLSLKQKFENTQNHALDRKYNKRYQNASVEEQRAEERRYKHLFNEQFEQLKNQKNHINENLEQKQLIRRRREHIQNRIKELKAKIKNEKKAIDGKLKLNMETTEQLNEQIEINQRLQKLDEANNQQRGAHGSNSESLMKENNQNFTFAHQLQDSPKVESNRMLQDQSEVTIGNGTSRNAEKGLYKYLIESDLKITKDRTLEQLETARETNDSNVKETDDLKTQNRQLKNSIKRYKALIHDLVTGKKGSSKDSQNTFKVSAYGEKKLDLETINQQMYKYGMNDDRSDGGRSSINGFLMGAASPAFTTFGKTMSFRLGKASLTNDLRKIEALTMVMPHIMRQDKLLDSIILQLKMIKEALKAQKVTLFIVDKDLQSKIFRNKNERKQNYKKMIVGGSNLIYALYHCEDDFSGPIFKSVDEIHSFYFTNKSILIPLKEKKTTTMTLQVIFDEKMKENKDKQPFQKGTTGTSNTPRSKNQSVNSNKLRRGTTMNAHAALKGALTAQAGFTHNDFNIMKILGNFLQMNIDYFVFKIVESQKHAKKAQIVDFAVEFMQVKSFRQIVQLTKKYATLLLGYEASNVFFQYDNSEDLFTITQLEVENDVEKEIQKKIGGADTSFAKELFFKTDQVMEFPATIGVSGEVHRKNGIKYVNNFGALITKEQDDASHDRLSENSSPSGKNSFKHPRGILASNATTPISFKERSFLQKKNTALEEIREIAPHAEQETLKRANYEMQKKYRRGSADQGDPIHKAPASTNQNSSQISLRNDLYSAEYSAENKTKEKQSPTLDSPQKGEGFKEYLKNMEEETKPSPPSLSKLRSDDPVQLRRRTTIAVAPASPGLREIGQSGNILDLAYEKLSKKKQPTIPAKEQFFADFVPDMDNFIGVKNISNYIICSLKDDALSSGKPISVGILQLYNKLDGKNIDREDAKRAEHFANFIGGMSIKAHLICSTITQMIGLVQDFAPALGRVGDMDELIREQYLTFYQQLYLAFGSHRELFNHENGFTGQSLEEEESDD